MNKNQTAREIITGLQKIAIAYNSETYGLPIGKKYLEMEAFVLSKLDHIVDANEKNHLPGEGKPKHLRFDVRKAHDFLVGHPKQVMKDLGITYQRATPQSMADQWWFWNCENIPDPLPAYLTVMDTDPMKCIGFGLTKEEAEQIVSYGKEAPTDCRIIAEGKISDILTNIKALQEENAGLRDENGTVSDMNKWAMGRVEELEYALKKIEQMSDPGDYYKAICDMKSIATNVLNAVPIPTLSDDELKKKAEEIADRVLGGPKLRADCLWKYPAVISAMIEMYKLKL